MMRTALSTQDGAVAMANSWTCHAEEMSRTLRRFKCPHAYRANLESLSKVSGAGKISNVRKDLTVMTTSIQLLWLSQTPIGIRMERFELTKIVEKGVALQDRSCVNCPVKPVGRRKSKRVTTHHSQAANTAGWLRTYFS